MNAVSTLTRNLSRGGMAAVCLALIMLSIGVLAIANAQENRSGQAGQQTTVLHGDEDQRLRFAAIDVFVDSGDEDLAAYQFELASVSDGVEIVGIEGGEHAAFAQPPYYDPQAMSGNRVILAAFSTDGELPKGRSRVARIHVQLEGAEPKTYRTRLAVSANASGEQISAKVLIAETKA